MPSLVALRAFVSSVTGIIILALLAALIVQTVRIEGFRIWPISIHGLKAELADAKAGRIADRSKYEQAQSQAQAKNRAQVQRIEAEQEKVSADQQSKYARDLARLRAGGVRQNLAAPQSAAGGSRASPNGQAACRADAENLCVSRARIMQAAEIELGRNALIDWLNEQAKIQR